MTTHHHQRRGEHSMLLQPSTDHLVNPVVDLGQFPSLVIITRIPSPQQSSLLISSHPSSQPSIIIITLNHNHVSTSSLKPKAHQPQQTQHQKQDHQPALSEIRQYHITNLPRKSPLSSSSNIRTQLTLVGWRTRGNDRPNHRFRGGADHSIATRDGLNTATQYSSRA